MKCKRCGEIIDIGEKRCRRCGEKSRRRWGARFEPATQDSTEPRRPGIVRTLLSIFSRLLVSSHRSHTTHMTRHISADDTFRIEDQDTGVTRQWNDWSEVPDDVKTQILASRASTTAEDGPSPMIERVFDSMDGLPGNLEDSLRAMVTGSNDDVTIEHQVETDYSFTDESGETHRFKSLDEMPPEIRARFERLE